MKWHMVWIGCVALAGCDAAVVDGSGSGSSSTSGSAGSETNPTEVTTTPMTSTSDTTGPASSSSNGTEGTSSTGYEGTSSTGYEGTSSTGYEGSSSDSGTSTGVEGSSSSSSSSGIGFIDPSDTGPGEECDSYAQDCPEGEKCNPWANDGGSAWNALGCFPVDLNPGQIGDVCQVEGSGVSGVDTCDVGVMCWNVDAETNEGTCIGLCEGTPVMPTCADPSATCVIQNGGVLNLCLPGCDPLLQDCASGQACYPVDEGFVCVPDASGDDVGMQGDPCEFINACDPGLNCLDDEAYGPGCVGVSGCCSAFCDVNDIDPCIIAGQECLPWYEEGMAPMGLEDVGVCSVP